MRGVRIDLESLAECAHGWERIAWTKLPRDDRLPRGVDYLFVKRDARLEREAERNHRCIMTHNTPGGVSRQVCAVQAKARAWRLTPLSNRATRPLGQSEWPGARESSTPPA